mmetsp:Transcript_45440/g.120514  ORF Transcript_45440/g.120514 Transcript_45440/m.120514 type:complete len:256 (+) Transcript_45440:433-1200(+)
MGQQEIHNLLGCGPLPDAVASEDQVAIGASQTSSAHLWFSRDELTFRFQFPIFFVEQVTQSPREVQIPVHPALLVHEATSLQDPPALCGQIRRVVLGHVHGDGSRHEHATRVTRIRHDQLGVVPSTHEGHDRSGTHPLWSLAKRPSPDLLPPNHTGEIDVHSQKRFTKGILISTLFEGRQSLEVAWQPLCHERRHGSATVTVEHAEEAQFPMRVEIWECQVSIFHFLAPTLHGRNAKRELPVATDTAHHFPLDCG